MNAALRFLRDVLRPSPRRVVLTAALSALLIGFLYIPVANIPAVIAAWPLFCAVPQFAQSGPDVEWSFVGPVPKSATAFAGFFVYFAVVVYLLLFAMGRKTP